MGIVKFLLIHLMFQITNPITLTLNTPIAWSQLCGNYSFTMVSKEVYIIKSGEGIEWIDLGISVVFTLKIS